MADVILVLFKNEATIKGIVNYEIKRSLKRKLESGNW